MLVSLSIRDFVLIERLDLDFVRSGKGFVGAHCGGQSGGQNEIQQEGGREQSQ